jgi:predicted PurR-regulated permease PerM
MDERKVTIEFSFQTVFWIIVAVLSLWLVVALREVLVAFVLAFILAMAITPLVDFLHKKRVPRSISIVGVLLAVLGIAYLAISLILPPFVTEITNLLSNKTEYILRITENFNSLSPALRDNLNSFLTSSLNSVGNMNFNGVISGAKGVFNGLIEIVLIFALCFYMLQNNKGVEGVVVAYVPKQHQKRTLSIYRKISGKMSSWLGGQAVLGIIIFFVVLIGLSILKVEYALTLAIIAGILEVLPIIGPIVAGGLAVLISLTQSPILALIVLAFYVLVQQLENHILVPQVMKKSLGLNPIAVIMAIIIGGKLLGFVGILISVPIAAAVGVLLEEFVKKQEEEAK